MIELILALAIAGVAFGVGVMVGAALIANEPAQPRPKHLDKDGF